jgi:hypothetical protein
MFEIGIFCVVLLATGYWVVLWLMGRHDDVLHGDFIHAEEGAEVAPAALPPGLLLRQSLPSKSLPPKSLPPKSSPSKSLPSKSLPRVRPDSSDTLQSLLAAIKRDLKDATQL